MNRKTAPKVQHGKVQKKNRWEWSPEDNLADTTRLEIIRRAPGPGCVHVIDELDVQRFIALLPDWAELSRGLRSIVLEAQDAEADGWFRHDGVIAIPAWPRDMVRDVIREYYEDHAALLERIGVPADPLPLGEGEKEDDAMVRCWFDRSTARAFLLMHIFLHEVGHHVDHQSPRRYGRGEEFAEDWAYAREAQLWPRYHQIFGRPSRGLRR